MVGWQSDGDWTDGLFFIILVMPDYDDYQK